MPVLTALELSAAGYPAGTIKPRSGWISLDLPKGTIKPVPGGTDSHHITVVYLGLDVDDKAFAAACQRAKAAADSAPGPLPGLVHGVGSFPPSDSSDGKRPAFAKVSLPSAAPLRSALEDLSASEHASWKPHVTLAYRGTDEPLPPPVPRTPVKFTHLTVHRGKQVARFPLGGKQMAGDAAAVDLAVSPGGRPMDTSPFSSSTTSNWVARAGGLDPYIRGVAHALLRKGRAKDLSQAIHMAWGLMQDWAAGRTPDGKGHVRPAVQAAAAKALANMKAKAAAAHSHANEGGAVIDLAAWNEAAHPRVGAGATGGGQFTKGQQQAAPARQQPKKPARKPPARHPGAKVRPGKPPQRKPLPKPSPDHHVLTGARAAKAHQLRAQATQYRNRASAIRAEIRQEVSAIAAAVTAQHAAHAAAKRGAAARAAGKGKKAKAPVKPGKTPAKPKKATHKHATMASRAHHIARMRSQVATKRAQARALDREANKLDRQAAAL